MPKFEITMTRTYTLAIVREFDSIEEAEEFAGNHSWQPEDATDLEDHETIIWDTREHSPASTKEIMTKVK